MLSKKKLKKRKPK